MFVNINTTDDNFTPNKGSRVANRSMFWFELNRFKGKYEKVDSYCKLVIEFSLIIVALSRLTPRLIIATNAPK